MTQKEPRFFAGWFDQLKADARYARSVLAAVQMIAIAWFWPGRGLPLDDAWIHQVVGRTFAETGTLGYAAGHHGAAATSYLWGALLGLNFKIFHLEPSLWALLLNGASAIATGQLLFSILRAARPLEVEEEEEEARTWSVTSFFATLIACLAPNTLFFVTSGMEAMPFVALSLAAIVLSVNKQPTTKHVIGAGCAAGALALLRPEAGPLGALLALYVFWRTRDLKAAGALLFPWIAAVGVYVGSNLAKTGHALPSTLAGRRWLWFGGSIGLTRADHAFAFLDAWVTRLSTYTIDSSLVVIWILAALAAYGAFRVTRGATTGAARDADGARLLVAWALFHAAFYALLLPTPGHGGRYQPFTPLLFCAFAPIGAMLTLRALVRVLGVKKVRLAWFAALGLLPWAAMLYPIAGSLREANALAVAHIHNTELGAGRFVADLPTEGAIASFDIGGMGIASHRPILDLGGLSDPTTATMLEQGRAWEWLEKNQVRYVVLPQPFETTLPVFDDYRSRLHLLNNPALRLTPIRVFETPLDKWVPAIAATWNAAPKQVVYEVEYTKKPGPREVAVVAADVKRPLLDPIGLAAYEDRAVTEHMLAVLSAWGMDVDLKVTLPDPPSATVASASAAQEENKPLPAALELASGAVTSEAKMTGPCAIRMGFWGYAVDGCASIAGGSSATILRSMLFEDGARFLDLGDFGGALRIVPHVLAKARRRIDPRFHPPLTVLEPPQPGGHALPPAHATGSGLWIFSAVLVLVIGLGILEKKNLGLGSLIAKARARVGVVPAIVVLGLMPVVDGGCAPKKPSVIHAISKGRGAVLHALESGGEANGAALLEAATQGDPSIVALLLERGARTDARAPDGATALHHAARRGHGAAVFLLVAAMRKDALPAAVPGKEDKAQSAALDLPAGARQRTALHDATTSGSSECVTALLEGGANPSKADAFEQTPLHLLAGIDGPRAAVIAAVLRAHNADPRLADARGFTPLHAAAAADNFALARILLNGRSDLLEQKTPAGETPFDVAARYQHDRVGETLIRLGANVGADAHSPLQDAARMDSVERTAALLAIGIDPESVFRGQTALEVAEAHGSKRVEALLRAAWRK